MLIFLHHLTIKNQTNLYNFYLKKKYYNTTNLKIDFYYGTNKIWLYFIYILVYLQIKIRRLYNIKNNWKIII